MPLTSFCVPCCLDYVLPRSPELPTTLHEMEFAECSSWGVTSCVGASHVIYLYKGAKFKVRFNEQEGEITWVGTRSHVEFTMPAPRSGGRAAEEGDTDTRELLEGAVLVDVIEGLGQRASNPKVVAKRAGMPKDNFCIPFATRLKMKSRPNAPVLVLKERTPYDFVLQWEPPKDGGVVDDSVTHYEVQLRTTAPSGTYYPWRALWCGAGHESPDFSLARADRAHGFASSSEKVERVSAEEDGASRMRSKSAKASTGRGSTSPEPPKRRGSTQTPEPSPMVASGGGLEALAAVTAAVTAETEKKEEAEAEEEEPETNKVPTYTYRLAVDPSLFGQVRIRCWSRGEVRPSPYSEAVSLPRHKGIVKGVDATRQEIVTDMKAYFGKLSQHVTTGQPLGYRIGNAASLNTWGGDAPPPPPPPTAQDLQTGLVMAPVPYDVPRLPKDLPGLTAAGDALARYYRDVGVIGGGGGVLFGLRIDHVLHAITGSPTTDGQYSPRRTVASLEQPLLALVEVAYADVICPLLDVVSVLKPQWQLLDEKLYAIVAQIAAHSAHYAACEQHLREILVVMLDWYETMQQSAPERALTFHLEHSEYSKAAKQKLAKEFGEKLATVAWRLSHEVVEMMIDIRQAMLHEAMDYTPTAEAVRERHLRRGLKRENTQRYGMGFGTVAASPSAAPATEVAISAGSGEKLEAESRGLRKAGMYSVMLVKDMNRVHKEAQERAMKELNTATSIVARAQSFGSQLKVNVEVKAQARAVAAHNLREEALAEKEAERARAIAEGRAKLAAVLAKEQAEAEVVQAGLADAVVESEEPEESITTSAPVEPSLYAQPYNGYVQTPYRRVVLAMAMQPNKKDWATLRESSPPPSTRVRSGPPSSARQAPTMISEASATDASSAAGRAYTIPSPRAPTHRQAPPPPVRLGGASKAKGSGRPPLVQRHLPRRGPPKRPDWLRDNFIGDAHALGRACAATMHGAFDKARVLGYGTLDHLVAEYEMRSARTQQHLYVLETQTAMANVANEESLRGELARSSPSGSQVAHRVAPSPPSSPARGTPRPAWRTPPRKPPPSTPSNDELVERALLPFHPAYVTVSPFPERVVPQPPYPSPATPHVRPMSAR